MSTAFASGAPATQGTRAVSSSEREAEIKAAFLNAHLDAIQACTGERSYKAGSVAEISVIVGIIDRLNGKIK